MVMIMTEYNYYIENLKKAMIKSGKTEKETNSAVKYATNLISMSLPVIFDIKHLSKLLGTEDCELINIINLKYFNYKEIKISKKSGGCRILRVPSKKLSLIQRWILDKILYNIPVSDYSHGFCKNRSIVTNAKCHLNSKCLINIDIKDYFGSINSNRIFNIFYYYGYTKKLSYILSQLCTYRNSLPQGGCTSPYLSNIVSLKLDKRLSELANCYNANYSRYADDISFSGNRGIQKMLPIVEKILNEEGFQLNNKKTRILFDYQRQEINGIIVNGKKLNIKKKYKKDFMQEIYYCKKFGVRSHLNFINSKKRFYKEYMYGKASYINMIDGNLGKKILMELNEINWES